MNQYNLIPSKQQRQSGVSPRIIIIALLILLVIIIVSTLGRKQDTALVINLAPTDMPTMVALHYAWIEGRDTCPESPEYRLQVAPGANLWESPGKPNIVTLVPHGALVGILNENTEWTHIDYASKRGYVQSYLVVEYDPLKEFKPATGDRYCLLCTLTCTSEDMDIEQPTPVVTSTPKRPANINTVTLRAPVGQTMVQMFDTLAANAEVIARFNSGTHCTKLENATDVAVEGITMSFYKIECSGTTGYVNAKWVQTR